MEQDEITIDAPIAGMSLTSEIGSRPWQKPSQYNVDYKTGLDELDDASTKALERKAIREFKKEMNQEDNTEEQEGSILNENVLDEPSGLMSRRV